MKRLSSLVFAILAALSIAASVSAQTTEAIWMTANTTDYKTKETVIVALNAASTTPIQGFTFQIRYDPACLEPVNASSPIPGMNGLPLPQISGLVDGSYASTTPQSVHGILAEIKFTTLKGCQTGLTLESAALAVRNTEGFAAPLSGVMIAEKNLPLNIAREVAAPQLAQTESTGSILPLAPPEVSPTIPIWVIGPVLVILLLGILRVFRRTPAPKVKAPNPSSAVWKAALHIKHGPQAGKSLALDQLPILIGRDPQNHICFNDPHVISQHAEIYLKRNSYYLKDFGGGTFINGHPVKSSTAALHRGDVVRLGKSVVFIFG